MIIHSDGAARQCTQAEAYARALHAAARNAAPQYIVKVGGAFEVVDRVIFATSAAYAFARTFRSHVLDIAYPDGALWSDVAIGAQVGQRMPARPA